MGSIGGKEKVEIEYHTNGLQGTGGTWVDHEHALVCAALHYTVKRSLDYIYAQYKQFLGLLTPCFYIP